MYYLTLAVPLLSRYLRDLVQHPHGSVRCPAGVSRWAGHVELLIAGPGSEVERFVLLSWTDTFMLPSRVPPDCAGVLLLGHNRQRGHVRGVIRQPSGTLAPFDVIR